MKIYDEKEEKYGRTWEAIHIMEGLFSHEAAVQGYGETLKEEGVKEGFSWGL